MRTTNRKKRYGPLNIPGFYFILLDIRILLWAETASSVAIMNGSGIRNDGNSGITEETSGKPLSKDHKQP